VGLPSSRTKESAEQAVPGNLIVTTVTTSRLFVKHRWLNAQMRVARRPPSGGQPPVTARDLVIPVAAVTHEHYNCRSRC
jgi:hypothetical protein